MPGDAVRVDETRRLDLGGGVVYRRLSPRAVPHVDFFESVYPPGASSSADGRLLVHRGYETGNVIRGAVTFEFDDGRVVLGPGDSLGFPATKPHRVVNEGDTEATVVWLTVRSTPPA